jgi:hypothetical protein
MNLFNKELIMGWIQTYRNHKLSVFAPDPKEIDIKDIAHVLSTNCRFGGHCRTHYSISNHSLYVASILPPELKLLGLLHDAAEAYVGDLPRPIKKMIPEFKNIENKVLEAISIALEVPDLNNLPKEVHEADNIALVAEAKALFEYDVDNWTDKYKLTPTKKILSLTSEESEMEFLMTYRDLKINLKKTYEEKAFEMAKSRAW